MTQYLIYPDQPSCLTRSNTEALNRGCAPTGETQYWWAQLSGPTGQWALVIPDTDTSSLSGTEQAALQSATQLTASGWTIQ